MNEDKKVVTIIIPAWNHFAATSACVHDLSEALTDDYVYDVIVVDNGSTDGTDYAIGKLCKNSTVIFNRDNLGFPIAVNQGFRRGLGEYYLVLNNDVYGFKKGFVNDMLAAFDEKTAIVGDEGTRREADVEGKKIPYLAWYCVMVSRKALEEIGLLDSRFSPGNWEDVDWCYRAAKAGWNTKVVTTGVQHAASTTFRDLGKTAVNELLERNREKFTAKWAGDFLFSEAKT